MVSRLAGSVANVGDRRVGTPNTSHPRALLRYAQCWEDADLLLDALDVQPHHTCLSIASGGDNTLALLSRGPQRVIALDFNPAQIACLELKVAAFAQLSHPELLVLVGSRSSLDPAATVPDPGLAALRQDLYRRCRGHLSPAARQFWDEHPHAIAAGIGHSGRFERYLGLFRRWLLPLVQPRAVWQPLIDGLPPAQRIDWYQQRWDSWRWRGLFRLWFCRFTLGHLGTHPAWVRRGEGSLADHLLARTHYALTVLDPATNPYLQWIVLGHHPTLPVALRPENFAAIRAHLARLEWHTTALDAYLQRAPRPVHRFNLSNVFDYVDHPQRQQTLQGLHRCAAADARLAWWQRLEATPWQGTGPGEACWHIDPQSAALHARDQVFFYQHFRVATARPAPCPQVKILPPCPPCTP